MSFTKDDLLSELDSIEYGLAYRCDDWQDLKVIVDNMATLIKELIKEMDHGTGP